MSTERIIDLTDDHFGESLRQLAETAAVQLEGCPAEDILCWAAETFSGSFVLAVSLTDTVLAHVASRAVPEVPLVFVDTGYHFAETLTTLQAVRDQYGSTVHVAKPALSVKEQDAWLGPRLHDRDPDRCCAMRKVEPLNQALSAYRAWGSGLRRTDSENRRDTPVVDWDEGRSMLKVNPIATWTDDDVAEYAATYDLVVNPLQSRGYLSVGCAPCTRPVAPGGDARSGRWANTTKVECGIHHLLAGT